MSKLMYCLQLFGNVCRIQTMGETETRQTSFTKANLRNLQVLQNKVLRLMTDSGYNTPTSEFLNKSEMLSCVHNISLSFKIKKSQKPRYLAKRFGFLNQNEKSLNKRQGNANNIYFKLSRSRKGMDYQGSKLLNSLDPSPKMETNEKRFKKNVKKWILNTIPQIPY